MKYNFNKIFFFALASICFLASCNPDEETPAPSIRLINPPAANVDKGAIVSFSVEAKAQEKIEKVTITQKIGTSTTTVTGFPKTSGFKSSTEDLFVYEYEVPQESGDIILSFSVTDKRGKLSATDYSLKINPNAPVTTPMSFEKTGAILANKIGPDQSAWNLITNERKAGGSLEADMQNPTAETDIWIKGWNGVRGTVFVKANDFNYADATVEAATAAFAAGTSTSEVRSVAVNDIYIAKIKGGSHFAVIKVTHADNDIALSNAEKIEFTYKKLAEGSGS